MRLPYSFVALLLASALALGRADEVHKAEDRVVFKVVYIMLTGSKPLLVTISRFIKEIASLPIFPRSQ